MALQTARVLERSEAVLLEQGCKGAERPGIPVFALTPFLAAGVHANLVWTNPAFSDNLCVQTATVYFRRADSVLV